MVWGRPKVLQHALATLATSLAMVHVLPAQLVLLRVPSPIQPVSLVVPMLGQRQDLHLVPATLGISQVMVHV